MKIVAGFQNDFSPHGYEFFYDPEIDRPLDSQYQSIITVIDPVYATKFADVKQAEQWAEDNIAFMEDKLIFMEEDQASEDIFSQWKTQNKTQFRQIGRRDKTLSRFCDTDDPQKILEWHYLKEVHDVDFEVKYEHYKSWPDLFTVFNCIHGLQAYLPFDSDDKVIHGVMAVNKHTDYQTFYNELMLLDKYLEYTDIETTESDQDVSVKTIDIFDRYLSAGGNSCKFKYNFEQNVYMITGSQTFESSNLRPVFEFWQANRYYE